MVPGEVRLCKIFTNIDPTSAIFYAWHSQNTPKRVKKALRIRVGGATGGLPPAACEDGWDTAGDRAHTAGASFANFLVLPGKD